MNSSDSSQSAEAWQELDTDPRPPFHELRVQLHWAAQCVGAFGEALAEPKSDASHTSMEWNTTNQALVGMPTRNGTRLGLGLASPSLFATDTEGMMRARLPLAGQTLESCLAWVTEQVEKIEGEVLTRPLVMAEYAMPESPLSGGASFDEFDEALCEQVARWYGNTVLALEEVRTELPGTGVTRCWPHHFDIASLWIMDPEEDNPERARSIGCGMLLGDDSVPEPYFYCNPWPRPISDELPSLEGGGVWHVKGWLGAVLRSGELESGAATQAAQVAAFFRSAIEANRRLLKTRGA